MPFSIACSQGQPRFVDDIYDFIFQTIPSSKTHDVPHWHEPRVPSPLAMLSSRLRPIASHSFGGAFWKLGTAATVACVLAAQKKRSTYGL